MQLSVVIVNYNVKHFLEQCLCSVQKACVGIDAEILVVDNNSTDGSRFLLETAFPEVNFIWNSINVGFAQANNQAIAMAKGDYVLILNPDTILPEDSLTKSIGFLQAHPEAGALGIRMVDGSGKFLKESKRAFPSPVTSLFKLSGLSSIFPKSGIFARYHLGHLPEDKTHEVDVLAGAFMMISKQVLEDVGSFDEQFFMYGEDVDLSFRIQKAGYKNYYFAGSTIIHFKGESTKRGSLNYVRMFYKAMSLFVKKHYSGGKAGVFIFLIQIAILIRAVFTALGQALKKIGLPVLDAAVILSSFMIVKFFWGNYVRDDIDYSPQVLYIGFPAFTVVFLVAAFYAGLYDKGYRQLQLVRSTLVAGLVLLSVYALLPEQLRFSRGILVLGILLSFLLMNFIRRLFIQWRYLETGNETDERRQTIVVAAEKDYAVIKQLMEKAGMHKRVLGRVDVNNNGSASALGNLDDLQEMVSKYPIREIIFCENGLTFKKIIEIITQNRFPVRNKFHASCSSSIVGSDSKNWSGDFVAASRNFNIAKPTNQRFKRLFDIVFAITAIICFPVFIFLQKKPAGFYRNVFFVLLGKKTWVGYSIYTQEQPPLKPGVLSSTALPAALNDLPVESLRKSDEWYATGYTALTDIKKLGRGFKYLGY